MPSYQIDWDTMEYCKVKGLKGLNPSINTVTLLNLISPLILLQSCELLVDNYHIDKNPHLNQSNDVISKYSPIKINTKLQELYLQVLLDIDTQIYLLTKKSSSNSLSGLSINDNNTSNHDKVKNIATFRHKCVGILEDLSIFIGLRLVLLDYRDPFHRNMSSFYHNIINASMRSMNLMNNVSLIVDDNRRILTRLEHAVKCSNDIKSCFIAKACEKLCLQLSLMSLMLRYCHDLYENRQIECVLTMQLLHELLISPQAEKTSSTSCLEVNMRSSKSLHEVDHISQVITGPDIKITSSTAYETIINQLSATTTSCVGSYESMEGLNDSTSPSTLDPEVKLNQESTYHRNESDIEVYEVLTSSQHEYFLDITQRLIRLFEVVYPKFILDLNDVKT